MEKYIKKKHQIQVCEFVHIQIKSLFRNKTFNKTNGKYPIQAPTEIKSPVHVGAYFNTSPKFSGAKKCLVVSFIVKADNDSIPWY